MHSLNGIESFRHLSRIGGLSVKASLKTNEPLFSGEGNLLHHSAGSSVAINSLVNDVSGGVEVQSDSVILGALSADIAPTTSGFPVDNDEYELDLPSEGFSSIPEAIEDIQKGKVGLLVDVVIFMDGIVFT